MISRKRLTPMIAAALVLCVFGLALLFFGCAVRHLPGGATQPATRFEQILAWNEAIAAANDGFADNVIGVEQVGMLPKDEAKQILTLQAKIAQADKRITSNLRAAASCGMTNAGSKATGAEVSDASAACAQTKGAELTADVNLIFQSLQALNSGMLLGIKDVQKRVAVAQALSTIQNLLASIIMELREYKVIARLRPQGGYVCQLC